MPAKKPDVSAKRAIRVNRIATKKGERETKTRLAAKKYQRLTRHERKRDAQIRPLVAYDLETTRIARGTPRPLYITAYSENPNFSLSRPVKSIEDLGVILSTCFLKTEYNGCRFVAWNGNQFDVYLISAALLMTGAYVLRPYLTKTKNLRGLRVIVKGDEELPGKQRAWEFLDGISMLGTVGVSLEKFLKNFAPDHGKMVGVIDWEKEEFDADNPEHCAYAYRDSEGLYYGMRRAEEILVENFNQPLAPTIGNACMKIFKANIPEAIMIREPNHAALRAVRDYVMRGGFCFCVSRYRGPVWKYDLNQAYAAAMRDAKLPCGMMYELKGAPSPYVLVYIAEIEATNPHSKIPFYYKTMIDGRIKSVFEKTRITRTWLTSIEIDQLKAEGWQIKFHRHVFWDETFNMRDFVNRLEYIRMNCEGGPSGPIGTMVKAVGNNAYGKTLEEIEPIEIVMSLEQPPGFSEYWQPDDPEYMHHIWFRFIEQKTRDYHQPQIGAFITAHVRMVVRRAALLAPDHWLYADTDCCMFSCDVTKALDVHKSRYGAWKQEEDGAEYLLIAKKVYASLDTIEDPKLGAINRVKHSKGLNVKRLRPEDFERWFNGDIPAQAQVQRQNYLRVMSGFEMYADRVRKGTAI